MSPQRFRANTPQTIHEVIEGEVILVNLETGAYFSTDLVGTSVWNAVLQGLSQDEMVAQIAAQYAGEPETIRAGIQALLDDLLREGLIVPEDAPAASPTTPPLTASNPNRTPFVAPVLQKYTEMADLLLLDPIHDVDDSGWPSTSNKTTPNGRGPENTSP